MWEWEEIFLESYVKTIHGVPSIQLGLKYEFPGGSDDKASAYNARDLGLIPGLGRSPGEGNGNPLQYSCLENPMNRGAWQATVHGGHKELDTTEQLHSLKVLSILIWGMLGEFSQIISLLYSKVGDHFCDKLNSVVVKNLGFQSDRQGV